MKYKYKHKRHLQSHLTLSKKKLYDTPRSKCQQYKVNNNTKRSMRKMKIESFSTAKETLAAIFQSRANIQNLKRMTKAKHTNKSPGN